MHLIDTHAHLDDEQFGDALPEVVQRAGDAGVTTIVAVGTTATSSQRVIEIAEEFSAVYAAVGIQPNNCHEAGEGDWDRIVELAAAPRVVAIGETGLDRYWDFAPFDLQQDYFARHVRL